MVASATTGFFQDPPSLGNQFEEDLVLQSILRRLLPHNVYIDVAPELQRFGNEVSGEIKDLGDKAEDPATYPRIRQFDAWNRRIDELTTSEGWRQLHDVAAREGLVAIAYERKYGEYSRIYMFAKNYLWAPSSSTYGCPLSMTDGAARILEVLGNVSMKNKYLPKLTSRDPSVFWTSGQWMTERPGGSDVGRTETDAQLIDPQRNLWSINGFKWFSSATDANMTMLLARTGGKEGSRGLSLFLAEMKNDDGTFNGVRIHRLKNKYGTKALPTAELELVNMKAQLVGEMGRGVPNIASMLNITRIHSALAVVSALRRSLVIAKDYAKKRTAFGKNLDSLPLHIVTLMNIELTFRASMQLLFYEIQLLGRCECAAVPSKNDSLMLRLLTPMVKAWTAKVAVAQISECMEALGGQGYMEEIGIGRQLRDAQVNTIWEGTTNVLSLDVLRVLKETNGGALALFKEVVLQKVSLASSNHEKYLSGPAQAVQDALATLTTYTSSIHDQDVKEAGARNFSFSLTRTMAGALLIEHAAWALSNAEKDAHLEVAVAMKWCVKEKLTAGLATYGRSETDMDVEIVFGRKAKL